VKRENMDEPVIKIYRKLIREGFQYTGTIRNPSIYLDSIGEKIAICVRMASSYIHLYLKVTGDVIEDVKYLCMCDPTANVAVELLCRMIKGKTLDEARALTADSFTLALGAVSGDLLKRGRGLLELLDRGIDRFRAGGPAAVSNQ
jgi:NifU-like protein involved in Fe-S cluster formation